MGGTGRRPAPASARRANARGDDGDSEQHAERDEGGVDHGALPCTSRASRAARRVRASGGGARRDASTIMRRKRSGAPLANGTASARRPGTWRARPITTRRRHEEFASPAPRAGSAGHLRLRCTSRARRAGDVGSAIAVGQNGFVWRKCRPRRPATARPPSGNRSARACDRGCGDRSRARAPPRSCCRRPPP